MQQGHSLCPSVHPQMDMKCCIKLFSKVAQERSRNHEKKYGSNRPSMDEGILTQIENSCNHEIGVSLFNAQYSQVFEMFCSDMSLKILVVLKLVFNWSVTRTDRTSQRSGCTCPCNPCNSEIIVSLVRKMCSLEFYNNVTICLYIVIKRIA